MKKFLYADCAAAAQNILLGIHGLGLGGVWCGVVSNSDWRKLLIAALELPSKLEPVAVIAFGWPDEEKQLCSGLGIIAIMVILSIVIPKINIKKVKSS